ncbi:hypothetical protein BGX27_005880 [Mortierella sp. AM989]|nr:hypothetical protein BGX27_005880 [Mortierella sp. AM989]
MPSFPTKDDPLRESLSRFASGLEQFYDSLHQFHLHSSNALYFKTRATIFTLAVRCLLLQTILDFITSKYGERICASFNQLFFPTVLLVRYLHPDPWDRLFMNAVHALGCETRVDIVGRPGPHYFVQLRQFINRNFKAYVIIGTMHYLVNRRGVFAWPGIILSLLAAQQYLRYKGVQHPTIKLLVATTFIGPRWPVWFIQISIQQQLFLYELLQPYLARVQFKPWEENAWWAEHEMELRGFAFGVWLVCSIPVVGVATIPLMFPAVAFLLTRSCGLMENSGNGVSGDIIEKRTPGVKAIALGKSKAVSGNWDEMKAETLVQNLSLQSYKPTQHVKITESVTNQTAGYHSIDSGIGGAVSEEQIWADKKSSIMKKQGLRRDHQRQENQKQWERQQHAILRYKAEQQANVPSPPSHPSPATTSAPATSAAVNGSTAQESSTSESVEATRPEDLTQYNFSDRKPVETAPSAPPEPSFVPPLLSSDVQGWSNYSPEHDVYRVETAPDGTSVALPISSASGKTALGNPQQQHQSYLEAERLIWEERNMRIQQKRLRAEANRLHGETNRRAGRENRRMGEKNRLAQAKRALDGIGAADLEVRRAMDAASAALSMGQKIGNEDEEVDEVEEEDEDTVSEGTESVESFGSAGSDNDDGNGDNSGTNNGAQSRYTDIDYEEFAYYDRNGRHAEQIPMRSRDDRNFRQRRQNPRRVSEPSTSLSGQEGRTTGYEHFYGDEKHTSHRSMSQTVESIHRPLPFIPAMHSTPSIRMHDSPSPFAPPFLPMGDRQQNRMNRSHELVVTRAAWERGGLSAIVAQNIEDIDERISKELSHIALKMGKPRYHDVAPPASASSVTSNAVTSSPDNSTRETEPESIKAGLVFNPGDIFLQPVGLYVERKAVTTDKSKMGLTLVVGNYRKDF